MKLKTLCFSLPGLISLVMIGCGQAGNDANSMFEDAPRAPSDSPPGLAPQHQETGSVRVSLSSQTESAVHAPLEKFCDAVLFRYSPNGERLIIATVAESEPRPAEHVGSIRESQADFFAVDLPCIFGDRPDSCVLLAEHKPLQLHQFHPAIYWSKNNQALFHVNGSFLSTYPIGPENHDERGTPLRGAFNFEGRQFFQPTPSKDAEEEFRALEHPLAYLDIDLKETNPWSTGAATFLELRSTAGDFDRTMALIIDDGTSRVVGEIGWHGLADWSALSAAEARLDYPAVPGGFVLRTMSIHSLTGQYAYSGKNGSGNRTLVVGKHQNQDLFYSCQDE